MTWVVTREATAESDGEKQYKCNSCGYVEYTVTVPAFGAYTEETEDSIADAAQGATVTIDAAKKGWISMAPSTVRAIAARPDVTVVVDYKYEGVNYEMTIPAGADLSVIGDYVNAPNANCYGFRYLAQFFETVEK